MLHTYLTICDIEEIYLILNGGIRTGITSFKNEAKKIATKSRRGAYIFTDEESLWKLIQKHFQNQLSIKGIISFGHLMQYIS